MNQKEFVELSKRYSMGLCSKEEKILYESIYEDLTKESEVDVILSEKKLDAIKVHMYHKIVQESKEERGNANKWSQEISSVIWKVAVVVLLASATVLFLLSKTLFSENELVTFRAPKSSKSVLNLPDGSTVYLSNLSEVTYSKNFEKGDRMVELRGEAFFDIKRNEERPFVVKTEAETVTVLGTSFNVRSVDDEVFSVAVVSGTVQVANDQGSVLLYKGMVARKEAGTDQLVAFEGEEVTKYTGWMNGIIDLNEVSMRDAAKIIGRYYGKEIKVQGKIADCIVVGKYQNESLANILSGLKFSLNNLKIVWISEDELLLSGIGCD
jgi:transmembrane sensor